MALVTIGGKVSAINLTNHTIVITDKDGLVHPARWNPSAHINAELQKLQLGYFKSITGEVEDGVMKIEAAGFFDYKDFPKQNGGNKGGYPPRDPKVQTYIIRQSCLDRATQIVLHGAAVESELPALVKDIKEIAEVLEGWVLR